MALDDHRAYRLEMAGPFWPVGADDRTRAELLAEVRAAVDHVVGALPKSA